MVSPSIKTGDLYVADTTNDTIARSRPRWSAGHELGGHNPGWLCRQPRFADGTGTAALFQLAPGVAVDSSGNVYVADTGNGTNPQDHSPESSPLLRASARKY